MCNKTRRWYRKTNIKSLIMRCGGFWKSDTLLCHFEFKSNQIRIAVVVLDVFRHLCDRVENNYSVSHISPSALFYKFPLKEKTFHHIHFCTGFIAFGTTTAGGCANLCPQLEKSFFPTPTGKVLGVIGSDAHTCNVAGSYSYQHSRKRLDSSCFQGLTTVCTVHCCV